MRKAKAEMMARESADWYHRGLISSELSRRLAERYGRRLTFFSILGRWLGIIAVLLLAGSVMALIGMVGDTVGGGVLQLVLAGVFWWGGVAMTTSKTNPFPVTGSALVTVSFLMLFGALVLLVILPGGRETEKLVYALMLVVAACAAATAYGFRLRWPLFLAVLLLFHAIGASGWYGGRGVYYFDIQHPPSMAAIAAFVVACGVMHRLLEDTTLERYCGFGQIMIVIGLVYFNCALWFMSIEWRSYLGDELLPSERLFWVMLFSGAALAQIVLGGFLKDRTFTGFGIVFLAIDFYTQFFEKYWSKLSVATFLVIAGLLGMAFGGLFEFLYRRQPQPSAALPTEGQP